MWDGRGGRNRRGRCTDGMRREEERGGRSGERKEKEGIMTGLTGEGRRWEGD